MEEHIKLFNLGCIFFASISTGSYSFQRIQVKRESATEQDKAKSFQEEEILTLKKRQEELERQIAARDNVQLELLEQIKQMNELKTNEQKKKSKVCTVL